MGRADAWPIDFLMIRPYYSFGRIVACGPVGSISPISLIGLIGPIENPMTDGRLQHAVRLGMAVYRITERFPEHEPLRDRLRDAALAVVVSAAQDESASVAQAVRTLGALADFATPLGHVSPENFSVLKQFCESFLRFQNDDSRLPWLGEIRKEVRQNPSSKKRVSEEFSGSGNGVSRRRDRIVQILRKRDAMQLHELVLLLGGVSSRTVRRELNRLCKTGFVERRGFGASSFYRILA